MCVCACVHCKSKEKQGSSSTIIINNKRSEKQNKTTKVKRVVRLKDYDMSISVLYSSTQRPLLSVNFTEVYCDQFVRLLSLHVLFSSLSRFLPFALIFQGDYLLCHFIASYCSLKNAKSKYRERERRKNHSKL